DISADGNEIVFSQVRLNRYGETYRDLHIMSLDDNKSIRRLTNSARLHEPSFSPDGTRIAAIHTEDGTQNLVSVDAATGDITYLTSFTRNERLFRPIFSNDAQWLYLAMADSAQRTIRRYHIAEQRMETLLSDPNIDFRDPTLSDDNKTIYYASDRHGIFNIWSYDIASQQETQLTSVLGGALMPSLTKDGQILYSEYKWDGYKIAAIPLN